MRTVDADVVVILIGKYTFLVTKYPLADIGAHLSAHQYHLPHSVIYDKTSHLEYVKKPAENYLSKELDNNNMH